MYNKVSIKLNINKHIYKLNVEPRLLLVDLLRYKLKLTGTHIGCDTSQCGSCMVLMNDKCIKSCSILVVQCDNKTINTIENIGEEEHLHEVQKAFKENHGLQCGFCTPGFILSAMEMKKNNLSEENKIRKFLDGNLCRCTGYQNIVKSISSYLKM